MSILLHKSHLSLNYLGAQCWTTLLLRCWVINDNNNTSANLTPVLESQRCFSRGSPCGSSPPPCSFSPCPSCRTTSWSSPWRSWGSTTGSLRPTPAFSTPPLSSLRPCAASAAAWTRCSTSWRASGSRGSCWPGNETDTGGCAAEPAGGSGRWVDRVPWPCWLVTLASLLLRCVHTKSETIFSKNYFLWKVNVAYRRVWLR